MKDGLYRVVTRYLCAGFVVEKGVVTRCAPILLKRLSYWWTIATLVSLVLLVGCVPQPKSVVHEVGWPDVKEFQFKDHDYLITRNGYLIHAESCWNMNHARYMTNWVVEVTQETNVVTVYKMATNEFIDWRFSK